MFTTNIVGYEKFTTPESVKLTVTFGDGTTHTSTTKQHGEREWKEAA